MKSITVKNVKVTITPEYFGSFDSIRALASKTKGVFIGSYASYNEVGIAIYNNGLFIGSRLKHRLTKTEIDTGRRPGKVKPKVFEVAGLRILPIICYELLYPKDYVFEYRKVDLITHHVYSVMFDLCQYEGWKAMYHTLSIYFNCPVITSSGSPSVLSLDNRFLTMDVSGIVKPEDPNEEFLNKKFDKFRKI